jgi:hypothetical protein
MRIEGERMRSAKTGNVEGFWNGRRPASMPSGFPPCGRDAKPRAECFAGYMVMNKDKSNDRERDMCVDKSTKYCGFFRLHSLFVGLQPPTNHLYIMFPI